MVTMDNLPKASKVVVLLSGGMDSTVATRLCVEKYGAANVSAVSFNYGQRQVAELNMAQRSTSFLGVKHKIIDLSLLSDISQGFSANVDTTMQMPTIKEVLGQPQPKTYVPNRNMIMLSILAGYAETQKAEYIITGLQATDQYAYWDTTPRFVDSMNAVLTQNRTIQIKIIAPFVNLSKTEELEILKELDGNLDLLKYTLTCYNPTDGKSCGKCPSCAERIQAFMNIGERDPIPYMKDIPWNDTRTQVSA